MKPIITVVVCTYRRMDVLSGVLETLAKQSLDEASYQVIVVDNNSRDDTPKIVRCFAQQHPSLNLKYVLELQQGLSRARNTGINVAEGQIVAFIDDDAEADPEWLTSLLQVYAEYPDAWAVGGKVVSIWDGERPEWLDDSLLRGLSLVDWGDQLRLLEWPERIIGTNFSFRKTVFSEIDFFRTDLGRKGNSLLGNEDTEIQERIHQAGKQIVYAPNALVHHHVALKRLTKKYFYHRRFGTGRSNAILINSRDGKRRLLKTVIRVSLAIPKMLPLLIRSLNHEESRFSTMASFCGRVGFIYQSFILLFRKK